ncbi:hypothetical protein DP42_3885 [Burkholderia pseudomallei]|nr:hypothetical protein DP42_3885 [Burkholderia pseudomallei]
MNLSFEQKSEQNLSVLKTVQLAPTNEPEADCFIAFYYFENFHPRVRASEYLFSEA